MHQPVYESFRSGSPLCNQRENHNYESSVFVQECHCIIDIQVIELLQLFRTNLKLLNIVLIDFSLTVKAATLIFISGRGSAISSAKEGKSGFIYNLIKSY